MPKSKVTSDIKQQIRLIERTELLFRLAIAVRMGVQSGDIPRKVPVAFIFGQHTLDADEMVLSEEDLPTASAVFEYVSEHSLALQLHTSMEQVFQNPETHADESLRAAFIIVKLIRHAYAHGSLAPVWKIDRTRRDVVYDVPGVCRIDTRGLNRNPVQWQDYGGRLALYRLSQFIKGKILELHADAGCNRAGP